MTAATYRGDCSACDGRIQPGERIVRGNDGPAWIHAVCPPDVEACVDAAALAQPRCERCGLNHPGEC